MHLKKLGQAFGCLSNADKRRMYDMKGTDDASTPVFQRSYRSSQNGGQANFDDLDPEEIFRMFFGGTSAMQRGSFNYSFRPTTRRQPSSNPGEPAGGSNFFSFIQLLPLILLLLFSFLSSPSEPLFQLRKVSYYSVPRVTPITNISFFVKQDFKSTFENDLPSLRQVEKTVEETWAQEKWQECDTDTMYKKRYGRPYYKEKSPCDQMQEFRVLYDQKYKVAAK